jgi:hypothetical protein
MKTFIFIILTIADTIFRTLFLGQGEEEQLREKQKK